MFRTVGDMKHLAPKDCIIFTPISPYVRDIICELLHAVQLVNITR